jgi:hypothetical protein
MISLLFFVNLAEVRAPRTLTIQTSVKYNNVPCERKDELKKAIVTKVQSLQCITNQTCESTVSVNGCNSGSRRRRSTSDLEIIVTLFSSLNADASLDLESFYASKIGNTKCYCRMLTMFDLK